MKIVFWTEMFLPMLGGVETLCANLMRALGERGHELSLIMNSAGNEPTVHTWEGVRVFGLPFRRAIFRRDLREMRRLCEAARRICLEIAPDVMHFHVAGPSSFYMVHSGAADGVAPGVATVHGASENLGEFDGITGMLLDRVNIITVVSRFAERSLVERRPDLASKTRLVRNALPWPSAPLSNVPFAPRMLTCIGRANPEKGFDVAIDAHAALPSEYSDVRLTIVGNGPELERLIARADLAGTGDRVFFAGGVQPEDITPYIDASTVVLVPSRWREAFGLVALEALQRGRVVIASDTGGLPEVIVPGTSGVLVTRDDVHALTAAIVDVLKRPDDLCRLAASGRAFAEDTFDFAHTVSAYESIYEGVRRSPRDDAPGSS